MKIDLTSISAPRKPKATKTKKKEVKVPSSIEYLVQRAKPKLRLVHKQPGRYVLKSTRGVFSVIRIAKEVKYVPSMRQKIFALREMESLSSDCALTQAIGPGAYSEPVEDLEAEALSFEEDFLNAKGLDLEDLEDFESDSAAPGARNKAAGNQMGKKKRAPNMLAPGWHVFELPKAGGRTKRHYVGPRISGRRLIGIAQGESAPESAKSKTPSKATEFDAKIAKSFKADLASRGVQDAKVRRSTKDGSVTVTIDKGDRTKLTGAIAALKKQMGKVEVTREMKDGKVVAVIKPAGKATKKAPEDKKQQERDAISVERLPALIKKEKARIEKLENRFKQTGSKSTEKTLKEAKGLLKERQKLLRESKKRVSKPAAKKPAKGKKAPAKKPATSKQSDAENKKLQQSLQKEIARTARSKVKLVSTINKKQLQVIKLKARIDQAKDKDKKKELAQKARDINTELSQLKRDLKAVDKELTKATSNKKRIEAIEAQKPSTKGAKYDKAKASLLKRIKTMEDRIAKAEEAYQNGGTKTQRRKVEDLEYTLEELEYKLEELEEGAETKLASQSSKKVNLKHLGNVDWDKILEHGLSPAQRKKALKALEKEGYDEIDFSSPEDIVDDEILDALES